MKRLSKNILDIKALIIEDFSNGEIKTYYNKYEFENLIKKYSKNEVTRVFETTPQIKNEIIKIISKNMKDKDGEINVNIDGLDIFAKIFPAITDMDFDLDIREDYDYLIELINNPTEWMEEVLNVVIPRLEKVANELIDNVDKFNGLSKKEQKSIIDELKNIDSSKQIKEVENDLIKLNDNINKTQVNNHGTTLE
jgi:hypothetical protein